jgi:adenine/guanine/hypoxanthine permease
MKQFLESYFHLSRHRTTIQREVLGGVTTFLTVSYIIVVNPAILAVAGIPKGASTVATILTAAVGTLIMGLYARRPFAVAPYMGENAFIAFTVVGMLGYHWTQALGAVFLAGVIFVFITLFKVRTWFVDAIPACLKYAFAVGIGLFLSLLGLVDAGIVQAGTAEAPVRVGNLANLQAVLAVAGFIGISVLLILKIRGAILYGMVAITVAGFALGVTPAPREIISMPPSISDIFLKLDIRGALDWGFFPVILTIFVMSLVDTMGTLIGLSARAGLLDKKGNLPHIEKPMMADAIANVFAPLIGTTTSGAYIESAAGIEAGAKTGLASVVTALLFLLGLFFAPFLTSIPAYAYGPALVVVGSLMIGVIREINFDDLTELVPAFGTIILMCFTYNLGVGITAGFILYPLMKLLTGRAREVHSGMWALFALSLLFYIFYPYHR